MPKIVVGFLATFLVLIELGTGYGYYWRDYTGEVPKDAFPGGWDDKERTTYVGQTLQSDSLLPGTIRGSEGKIFYEYAAKEHTRTEDVKVLCSQHPEQLQWISVKIGDPLTSLDKSLQLVLGGHDKPLPLAIGRTIINETGELIVSKVHTDYNKFHTIALFYNGRGWNAKVPYEVLVYNSSVSTEEQPNCIQKCA